MPDPRHAFKVVAAFFRLEQPRMFEVDFDSSISDEDAFPRRAADAMDADEARLTPHAPPGSPQTASHRLPDIERALLQAMIGALDSEDHRDRRVDLPPARRLRLLHSESTFRLHCNSSQDVTGKHGVTAV